MTEWYEALGEWLGQDPFFTLLEHIGTFAGAISGVRMASIKRFDWFGAYVIGFVTALGGGTLRDIMLGLSPFWMTSYSYLITTFLAVVAVWLFGRKFITEQITWFVFDTIAIALFMVIGLEKAIHVSATSHVYQMSCADGFPWWCAIIMGVITAVFGGVLRDICINEVPLIFRKELYAMACAAGGMIYFLLYWSGVPSVICATVCVLSIFVIRGLAIRYHLGVPVLRGSRSLASEIAHHRHSHHHRPAPKAKENN